MSEADRDRIEIPGEATGVDAPQGTEAAPAPETLPKTEGTAGEDSPNMPGTDASAEMAEGEAAHGPSGATMAAMARTDEQSQAEAEAEKTKWERRRRAIRQAAQERLQRAYRLCMADGGLKVGISLATAVIAACIITIAGIFSDRMLGVVFWRAIIGFFVSGAFMGGVLYWLDRFGIPLFIAKHENQMQMEWLSEAEEPEESGTIDGDVSETEEMAPGELEELMPQEGWNVSGAEPAAGTPEGDEGFSKGESAEDAEVPQTGSEEQAAQGNEQAEGATQEQPSDAPSPDEDMGGIEHAVLDDAFASEEKGDAEPPAFAPMTADTLESLSAPKD